MALKAFDLVTGRRITPVTARGWDWTRNLSGAGDLTVDLAAEGADQTENLLDDTRAWRTVIVDSEWQDDESGNRVEVCRASGVVFRRQLGAESGQLACCGFADIFSRLLVINAALKDREIAERVFDPEAEDVVIPPDWRVHLSGSTGDMIIQLVELALQWQQLPIILPAKTGGSQYRDYYSVDIATVADRIDDIAGLIGGAEWDFQPRIIDGSLYHELLVGHPELTPHSWRLDATLPDVPVTEVDYREDATDLATDAWAVGGRQDDKILVARSHLGALEDLGWPRLMLPVTSHTTVSEVPTLLGHAEATTRTGSKPSEVFTFRVRRDRADVRPGDWIDLKWSSWYRPQPGWSKLKALRVEGGDDEWLRVSTRERI